MDNRRFSNLAATIANDPGRPKKRRPILPPQSQPKARLKALRKQQDARWARPGVGGTDSHGNPY